MRDTLPGHWQLQLPGWVDDVLGRHPAPYPGDAGKMRLAIALAAGNLQADAGGPFGAAVFDESGARLVAVGVNLVFAAGASLAHAEMVALTLAQKALDTPDLREHGLTLFTSAEPCAMCLGALPWSGVRRVVCGARDADVRRVGFDEGAKPPAWPQALEQRGISVTQDVLRDDACAVLAEYQRGQGRIY